MYSLKNARPKYPKKHRKSCEKLPWELVGCQGVKVFLLKDAIITTSVTTVIFITIIIWVFELSHLYFFSVVQFEFLSLVKIWSFKFCHNFFYFSFITVWVLEFCHNLVFFSFVTVWFCLVLSILDFFCFVTIRIF